MSYIIYRAGVSKEHLVAVVNVDYYLQINNLSVLNRNIDTILNSALDDLIVF